MLNAERGGPGRGHVARRGDFTTKARRHEGGHEAGFFGNQTGYHHGVARSNTEKTEHDEEDGRFFLWVTPCDSVVKNLLRMK